MSRLPRSRRKQDLANLSARIMRELERAPWTDQVNARFGETKAWLERHGQRLEDFDVAVAAHALAYDATLVTANARHMARIPELQIEDWLPSV